MPRFTFAAAIVVMLATRVLAWNAATHSVTGAIAYDILAKESPQTVQRVLELLKSHPQYEESFKAKLEKLPADQRDRYAFELIARWSDDVRMNRAYHHGPWHYINLPIVSPADERTLKAPAPDPENILTALSSNATAVKNGTPKERAVALCWLVHLVGDVHQPLHATAYFSSAQWPKGDRGGNLFYVRAKTGRAVLNLHSLWDGLVLGEAGYQPVSNMATELRLRPEFSREKLAELNVVDPAAWAQESYKLAVDVAYLGRTLKGSTDEKDGPVVPDGYLDGAKAIAERRVVVAGYRLAASLTQVK